MAHTYANQAISGLTGKSLNGTGGDCKPNTRETVLTLTQQALSRVELLTKEAYGVRDALIGAMAEAECAPAPPSPSDAIGLLFELNRKLDLLESVARNITTAIF